MWKLIKIAFILYIVYYMMSFYMTQRRIAEFAGTGHPYLFKEALTNKIAASDFAALEKAYTDPKQICPNISSSRNYLTVVFVNDAMVCCDTQEWLVPYRNVGSNREYLCGNWPSIEIISQPLDKTKLQLGVAELELK
ncbi:MULTISPECIES: hypothetical protein [unclassified Shewanella]|uniref:hypothetical protein n=1 Tax=Shewanella TaxID=22 RepID=UPI0021D96B6E|nr:MULTISPECIES: hypothetical protein [unclassified Shewanella]MCU8015007.1 hypothetical protein [Shewanella sp. SM74]MCU8056236.1 hypothetical protein [Shewanella sp. SM35]MCU8065170.1 hypothetical protein [Shewanella sp. SM34]